MPVSENVEGPTVTLEAETEAVMHDEVSTDILEENQESYASRLGRITMLARLYLLIEDEESRRRLVHALNREFDPEFFEPLT